MQTICLSVLAYPERSHAAREKEPLGSGNLVASLCLDDLQRVVIAELSICCRPGLSAAGAQSVVCPSPCSLLSLMPKLALGAAQQLLDKDWENMKIGRRNGSWLSLCRCRSCPVGFSERTELQRALFYLPLSSIAALSYNSFSRLSRSVAGACELQNSVQHFTTPLCTLPL